MEPNIVVLLDYESQQIRCFGECFITIAFEEAFLLPYLLEGGTALYINSADEVNSDDIINTLETIIVPNENPEPRYIHSTVEGYLKVEDINLVFAGPKDAKSLERLGYDIFSKSKKLREFLRQGKIKIVTETVAKSFRKPLPGVGLRDAALDKILLKKPFEQVLADQENIFEEGEIDEIGEDTEVETEAEKMIKKGFGKR